MLFTGEYEYTIDAKHRIAIPAEIRSRLGKDESAFYLVPGPNGALWMWPEPTFDAMAGAMEQTLLPGEEIMEFEELLFSQAARLDLDGSGRVRLPERLLTLAGISDKVMILGVRDHLELRDPQEWRTRLEEKLGQKAEIMLRARRALAERRESDRST